MDTLRTIARRRSTRSFKPGQIPDHALNMIINAGCAAPVAKSDYTSVHITVIQNERILGTIRKAIAQAVGGTDEDLLYGAPTLIIISSRQTKSVHIEVANAACIAENMMLMATDINIGSVYILGTVLAFQSKDNWLQELGIPENFYPAASVALGNPVEPLETERPLKEYFPVNRIP
ncbi:nitroreductase family protein [Breznakiella homolactica]|uniref:Nitroreductase family protein n=1 Tax=Breznakiella homolactica TaxID=2798577 RepID=A0A7T8BCH0_9SPIR|nr:nitroreductase family protein [Breznakiella homolactica]QQO10248.1 nitroreductase family protein [Breznakiella homolactica]